VYKGSSWFSFPVLAFGSSRGMTREKRREKGGKRGETFNPWGKGRSVLLCLHATMPTRLAFVVQRGEKEKEEGREGEEKRRKDGLYSLNTLLRCSWSTYPEGRRKRGKKRKGWGGRHTEDKPGSFFEKKPRPRRLSSCCGAAGLAKGRGRRKKKRGERGGGTRGENRVAGGTLSSFALPPPTSDAFSFPSLGREDKRIRGRGGEERRKGRRRG